MHLRSGRNTGEAMSTGTLRQTAKLLQQIKSQRAISPTVKQYGWFKSSVNEKLKEAPEALKKNCEFCLRQIVEESILRGINIKFKCQWSKKNV